MPGAPLDEGDHSPTPPVTPALGSVHDVLDDARRAGFLGPGPLDPQIRHAASFAAIARRLASKPAGVSRPHLVDLGSGGGLPGLVVASLWPDVSVVLVEANGRRASFLRTGIQRLGLEERARVIHERAEVVGRQSETRGSFDGVLARSFGPPAVLAECAAPLLVVGGFVVVSEPPRGDGDGDFEPGADSLRRWPAGELAQLGLEPVEAVHEEFEFQVLAQVAPCPDRFPRRVGVPAKRPLF